jgi:hypothetical protein
MTAAAPETNRELGSLVVLGVMSILDVTVLAH